MFSCHFTQIDVLTGAFLFSWQDLLYCFSLQPSLNFLWQIQIPGWCRPEVIIKRQKEGVLEKTLAILVQAILWYLIL